MTQLLSILCDNLQGIITKKFSVKTFHAMIAMRDMVVGEAAKASKGQKLPWEPFGSTKEPTSFHGGNIYIDSLTYEEFMLLTQRK